MAAIEILGLEKTYMVGFWRKRPKRALQPLHLTVEEGEIFGFLGPNGAGKTTTLKMLMGLVFPTAGTARILGRDWTDPEIKAQIGFLPEQPYFYDYLTAHELLDYYGQLSGVPGKDRKRRVEEVLQRVGLTDMKGVQLRKFSKGMLQRAGIAQAILHNPKLLARGGGRVADPKCRGGQRGDVRVHVHPVRQHRVRPGGHDARVAARVRRAPAVHPDRGDHARAVDGAHIHRGQRRLPGRAGRRLLRGHPGPVDGRRLLAVPAPGESGRRPGPGRGTG